MKPIPCICPAYPFPHRLGGGDCEGDDPCDTFDRHADDWHNDPRRGESEAIERENAIYRSARG